MEVQHCKLGSEKTFVACKFGEAVTMAEWRRSVKSLQRNTVGSNPTFPTNGRVAEWLMAADCKSALFGVRRFESYPYHNTEVVKCNNDTVLEGESLWSPGENIQIRSKVATWFCINAGLFS